MAKYFQEPPSLAGYEKSAQAPRWSLGATPPSMPKKPAESADEVGQQAEILRDPFAPPVKKGIKQRSLQESWARGLMLMGAGLGFFALLSTASALLLDTGIERPLLAWVGAGLVVLAGRQAAAALLADPPYQGPYYRPGGPLMLAGLALVFLGPWVLTALS